MNMEKLFHSRKTSDNNEQVQSEPSLRDRIKWLKELHAYRKELRKNPPVAATEEEIEEYYAQLKSEEDKIEADYWAQREREANAKGYSLDDIYPKQEEQEDDEDEDPLEGDVDEWVHPDETRTDEQIAYDERYALEPWDDTEDFVDSEAEQ